MTAGQAPLRELVVCSLEPWDAIWRRNQHLVAELLRIEPHLRVLFVEPPADVAHAALTERQLRVGRRLRRPGETDRPRLALVQPTKLLPRLAGPASDGLLFHAVVRAARRLGFSAPLLWVNDLAYAGLLPLTGWPALYDVTDDWLSASCSERERHRRYRNEALLLQRAATVVACSPRLAADKGRARPVQLVTNGVDAERFREPAPRPGDLPTGPTAVYLGTLHEDRLDVALCEELARRLSTNATLVLIGPDALQPASRALLAATDRIAILGARPHEAVPAYLQHADVLVVPHVCTPFTESLDPLKAYEYRAVGRPVVTTPVAGFRGHGTPVTLAEPAGFADAVVSALRTGPPPPAVLPAPDDLPTWRQQAAAMRDALVATGRRNQDLRPLP